MLKYTTTSADTVSEFGRMIGYRVPADAYWGTGREENLQRQRPQVVKNMIVVGMIQQGHMTLVLTPEI